MREGLKIRVRKWRVKIESSANCILTQFSNFFLFVPFPFGEGVASASEQRPGVTSWQRSNPFFLCLYQTAKNYPPPFIKEGGVKIGKLIPYEII